RNSGFWNFSLNRSLDKSAPVDVRFVSLVRQCLFNGHFSRVFYNPFEIVRADAVECCVRSRIAIIDSIWDAIAYGKFYGIKLIPEGVIDLEYEFVNFLHQFRIVDGGLINIAQVVWITRFIWHNPNTVTTKVIATEIRFEIDVLLEHHDKLTSLVVFGKEIVEAGDLINTFPSTARVWL